MAKIEPPGNANPAAIPSKAIEAIAAEGLACRRGAHIVVSGLSFEAGAGTALILRGPNGSGKTTLLRTLAGFLPPAAGRIEIKRRDHSGPPHPQPLSQPYPQADMAGRGEQGVPAATASPLPSAGEGQGEGGSGAGPASGEGVFHYIGHTNGIKLRLSVFENLRFWQRYYGGAADVEAAEAALEAFGLIGLAGFSAAHLSQGQARRLGLSRLLAAQRPVWLLDEPSVSLDAASARLLEHAIARHLSAGGLAIVSTHLDLAIPDAAVLELGKTPVLQ